MRAQSMYPAGFEVSVSVMTQRRTVVGWAVNHTATLDAPPKANALALMLAPQPYKPSAAEGHALLVVLSAIWGGSGSVAVQLHPNGRGGRQVRCREGHAADLLGSGPGHCVDDRGSGAAVHRRLRVGQHVRRNQVPRGRAGRQGRGVGDVVEDDAKVWHCCAYWTSPVCAGNPRPLHDDSPQLLKGRRSLNGRPLYAVLLERNVNLPKFRHFNANEIFGR